MDYKNINGIILQHLIISVFYIFALATSGMIVELFIGINKKRAYTMNSDCKNPCLSL
jgi:hypothetical protein